jgi:hypothetical protein
MPLIQVRDMPEDIYRLLVEQAERQGRSLDQHVIAVLSRGIQMDVNAKARRRALVDRVTSGASSRGKKVVDPARLIRDDRRR